LVASLLDLIVVLAHEPFGRRRGGLVEVPAPPAASLLASEAAALGANVIVIANTST